MRVVIADDQRVVREGLATIVGTLPKADVVGLAANGEEAVALATEHRPDVVLMDLRMPVMDGVEATRAIRQLDPGVEVVVLTTYADDESIIAALSSGARGYLTKDASREDIRLALEAAAAGQAVLDPTVQEILLRAAAAASGTTSAASGGGSATAKTEGCDGTGSSPSSLYPSAALPDGLTEREGEVLSLIATGLSNAEIAARLYVAEVTVKTHVNRIFAKTHSRDRAQAVAYAHRHGLAT